MSTGARTLLRDDEAEQYRLLTESVKDYAIFLMDAQGTIITWNNGAKRILGYDDAEILGKPFSTIFTSRDSAKRHPEQELATAREQGRSEDERWHVRKNGTEFWASGVVTPLWDDLGKLRGYAKVLRDITDRKAAEVALAEDNRRKDEFLAMLAHELRNPLSPILTSLFVLQQDRQASDSQRQTLTLIDRQVRQIVRLVDDLLDLSRVTRGKVSLRKQRIELETLLAHAVETVKPLIDARKHVLSVSLPSESVWLDADPARLEQVIGNLLNNAAKYTEPGGRIWLSAEREGSSAIIRVRDDGIGILSEMLPRIFDMFTQADRSLERAQGGLGIGLTLARSLVQLHGGTIEARSPGVGQGSEFVVRLPVVAEVKPAEIDSAPAVEKAQARALKLLVVDDNFDTVESLAMLLRFGGHAVFSAHSGPSALQAFETHRPDVAILDIGLPQLDGFEVARHIRQRFGEEPVLIAMTGYGQTSDRERTAEAGFNHHLVKPIDVTQLQEILATCDAGDRCQSNRTFQT